MSCGVLSTRKTRRAAWLPSKDSLQLKVQAELAKEAILPGSMLGQNSAEEAFLLYESLLKRMD